MQKPAARIDFIDGLRGVAVFMVVIFHTWEFSRRALQASGVQYQPGDWMLSEWYQGVSLFLVLSGFCLSLPLWQRRARGDAQWFQPSLFFSRRIWRILPPYYVALTLFIVLGIVTNNRYQQHIAHVLPLTPWNILSHLLLVHNDTLYSAAINNPFWSLGLEWQWYWVFPLVIAIFAWRIDVGLILSAACVLIWVVLLRDPGAQPLYGGQVVLPERIFEFCAGVAVAALVTRNRLPSRGWCLVGFLAPLLVIYSTIALPPLQVPHAFFVNHALHLLSDPANGLTQICFAIIWAALIMLGYQSQTTHRLLSWRPLVALGYISYSVYLIHGPVVEFAFATVPVAWHASLVMYLIAPSAGITVGGIFYLLVERYFTRRSTWQRAAPYLARLVGWTDTWWHVAKRWSVAVQRRSEAL